MPLVTLNPAITMPISEAVHQVLLACGYSLVKQELLHLQYEKNLQAGYRHRITFGFGPTIVAENYSPCFHDDLGPGWYSEYWFRGMHKMKDMQVLNILQAWEYINYEALPEYKAVAKQAYREHRRKREVVTVH